MFPRREFHHRLDLRVRYREGKSTRTFHLNAWHWYFHCAINEEIAWVRHVQQEGLEGFQIVVVFDCYVLHGGLRHLCFWIVPQSLSILDWTVLGRNCRSRASC